MSRSSAVPLLAILGSGAFLAGMELMITAVALPAIVNDVADWTELRRASWIINGYLLVYIVAMPLGPAGRPVRRTTALPGRAGAVHDRLGPGRAGAVAR